MPVAPLRFNSHFYLTTLAMPLTQNNQRRQKEGRIALAIATYQSNPSQSMRALAASYNIPESTLRARLRGIQPKRKIASPLGTSANAEGTWTAEMPHTIDQLQRPARHIQEPLRRRSQSPTTQAIRQAVKMCQLMVKSNKILAAENSKLRQTLERRERRERKQRQRQQYITSGGALQAGCRGRKGAL